MYPGQIQCILNRYNAPWTDIMFPGQIHCVWDRYNVSWTNTMFMGQIPSDRTVHLSSSFVPTATHGAEPQPPGFNILVSSFALPSHFLIL